MCFGDNRLHIKRLQLKILGLHVMDPKSFILRWFDGFMKVSWCKVVNFSTSFKIFHHVFLLYFQKTKLFPARKSQVAVKIGTWIRTQYTWMRDYSNFSKLYKKIRIWANRNLTFKFRQLKCDKTNLQILHINFIKLKL